MDSWSDSYKAPAPKSGEQSLLAKILVFAIGVICALYAYTWIQNARHDEQVQTVLAAEPIELFSSEIRYDAGSMLFTENLVVDSQGQRLKFGVGRYLKTKQPYGDVTYTPQFLVINGEKLSPPPAKNAGEGQVYFLGREDVELPHGRNEFLFQYVANGLIQTKDSQQELSIDLLGPAITDTKSVQAVIYPPALVTKNQLRASAQIISAQDGKSVESSKSLTVEVISPPNPSPGSDNQSGAVRVATTRPLTLGEFVQVQVSWPQLGNP